MDIEEVLIETVNNGGYMLKLIAIFDDEGARNTAFVLRMESPYSANPIDFYPSQQDFQDFGLYLLGLSKFTDHNLYVDSTTVGQWKNMLRLFLSVLGLESAKEIADRKITVGGKELSFSELGRELGSVLQQGGKDLRGPPFDSAH